MSTTTLTNICATVYRPRITVPFCTSHVLLICPLEEYLIGTKNAYTLINKEYIIWAIVTCLFSLLAHSGDVVHGISVRNIYATMWSLISLTLRLWHLFLLSCMLRSRPIFYLCGCLHAVRGFLLSFLSFVVLWFSCGIGGVFIRLAWSMRDMRGLQKVAWFFQIVDILWCFIWRAVAVEIWRTQEDCIMSRIQGHERIIIISMVVVICGYFRNI